MEPPLSRRPGGRRLRLSLKALMVLVLVVGGGLGWLIHRATVQRDAVKAILAAGGKVKYDFEQNVRPLNPSGTSPGPKWLVDFLGVDYFADATSVTIRTPQADAILAHVGRLRRLERLDAQSSPVTDAGLAHLRGLSELRSLSCSGTPGLTDAGLAHLAGLERLEVLWIEGSMRIEGPGMAHLAGLHRLSFLCIDNETDAGLPNLSRLTGLRKLLIGITKVTDVTLAQLARLTWLEELQFGGETGSDAGMDHLRALTNLKTLQVYGPWFTDAGLAPVSEMNHLSTFFVADETSVTAVGLNNLQQQRPALRLGVNGTGRVAKARLDDLRSAVGPKAMLTGPR
jgi:internalin A